jgi:hypothetical protein
MIHSEAEPARVVFACVEASEMPAQERGDTHGDKQEAGSEDICAARRSKNSIAQR